MLTGPIPATPKVLERAKMTLDDIDLVEINEAFASVVLAWEKELNPDMARVNVNGGAIALGHPLGASGAKLAGHAAQRARAHRRPLRPADMCEGGGHGQRDDHRATGLIRPRSAVAGGHHEAGEDEHQAHQRGTRPTPSGRTDR